MEWRVFHSLRRPGLPLLATLAAIFVMPAPGVASNDVVINFGLCTMGQENCRGDDQYEYGIMFSSCRSEGRDCRTTLPNCYWRRGRCDNSARLVWKLSENPDEIPVSFRIRRKGRGTECHELPGQTSTVIFPETQPADLSATAERIFRQGFPSCRWSYSVEVFDGDNDPEAMLDPRIILPRGYGRAPKSILAALAFLGLGFSLVKTAEWISALRNR